MATKTQVAVAPEVIIEKKILEEVTSIRRELDEVKLLLEEVVEKLSNFSPYYNA